MIYHVILIYCLFGISFYFYVEKELQEMVEHTTTDPRVKRIAVVICAVFWYPICMVSFAYATYANIRDCVRYIRG